ncbi:MAG: alpha/beta hydrolase family protein, partial [Dehalococcoidia bacterium]
MRREEITFTSGELLLAGTLLLPSTEPPYPAIVFVHGSGPGRRESFGALPYLFAANGFGVLAYDKRGSGGAAGDWRRATFDELADDVIAAASMLTQRPEIDSARIGLYGSSQGGWIAPLAAARCAGVAFVVVVCGSGVTPAEQMLYLHEQRLRQPGFGDGDISAARALLAMRNEVARTNEGWPAFDAAVEQARAQPWFAYVDTPPLSPPRQRWAWRFWNLTNDHD